MHNGPDAQRVARMLVERGYDFHSITEHLEREAGLDRQSARIAAARAMHPEPPAPTLAAELAAIARRLDLLPPRH